jgi:hypothetical protein
MENKNSMCKRKFEYYMNALHYGLYKWETWSNFKAERQVYGLIGFLSIIFGFRKYHIKRINKLHNDKKLQEYLYGENNGLSIGTAHHLFGFFYSGYPSFLSFVIGGIYIRFYDEFDCWLLILFAIPVVICYIPAYKAVFTKDKYLKYFKQFEKRDDSWHNKWKWITIAFCIGSVVVSLLGICVALGILFFNK